jgi:hypothetical protein
MGHKEIKKKTDIEMNRIQTVIDSIARTCNHSQSDSMLLVRSTVESIIMHTFQIYNHDPCSRKSTYHRIRYNTTQLCSTHINIDINKSPVSILEPINLNKSTINLKST